jgi:DNA-binding GntR family transcriptional regulator
VTEAHEPRGQVVARQLAQQVEEGRRRPGERLWEEDLAAEFAVSRGTVREALAALVREGLAVQAPRRGGVRVVEFAPADIAEIYDIRGALYGLALSLFTARATPAEREEFATLREGLWCGLPPEQARAEDCVAVGGASTRFVMERCGNPRLEESYRRVALQVLRLYAPLHYRRPAARRAWFERSAILASAVRLGDAALADRMGRELIEANKRELVAALEAGETPAAAVPEPPRTRRAQKVG